MENNKNKGITRLIIVSLMIMFIYSILSIFTIFSRYNSYNLITFISTMTFELLYLYINDFSLYFNDSINAEPKDFNKLKKELGKHIHYVINAIAFNVISSNKFLFYYLDIMLISFFYLFKLFTFKNGIRKLKINGYNIPKEKAEVKFMAVMVFSRFHIEVILCLYLLLYSCFTLNFRVFLVFVIYFFFYIIFAFKNVQFYPFAYFIDKKTIEQYFDYDIGKINIDKIILRILKFIDDLNFLILQIFCPFDRLRALLLSDYFQVPWDCLLSEKKHE